jgi:hypothetical protein
VRDVPVIDNGSVVRHVVPPAPPPVATQQETVYNPVYLFPGSYDIAIYRGDSYEWWFVLKAIDVTTGNLYPCNITGWRFKAEIRNGPDAPLMASLQEVARDDEGGVVALRLIHSQSRLLESSGVWDLEAIMPDGWVRTVLQGKVTLVSDVTTGDVDLGREYTR